MVDQERYPARRKGSKHDRNGCLTCRRRRKKCVDNTFPICGACKRLNLECVRAPPRRVGLLGTRSGQEQQAWSPDGSHNSSSLTAWAPSLLPYGRDLPPSKRHAMRYYATVLTQHLTVSEQFNSFLTAFLPMAMESEALRDSLSAFACSHLSLVEPSYTVPALETRAVAIRALATSIGKPCYDITWCETNAAACLALLASDVSGGDCNGWYHHLVGTKNIILSAARQSRSGQVTTGTEAFKESPEGQWVLRNFAYHDIIGSVTLQKRPLLDYSYLSGITNVVDSYLGVGTELLTFIARISCLNAETEISEGISAEEAKEKASLFHSLCPQLEKELRDWKCPDDSSPGLVAVAYAFRSAALILLYRFIRSRLADDELSTYSGETWKAGILDILQSKLRVNVEDILTRVSDIPFGTAPESAVLFPLFLAGGETTSENQMEAIRTRLRKSLERRRFQNISRALQVLEDLWRVRQSQGGTSADWTHILSLSGVDLLLT